MRRRSIPLFLAVLASMAAMATVLGGGWAEVTVTAVPADPPAEAETTIGMTVMQHGETAVSWPALTVVATETETGATVRADARPEGPVGAYVAKITFPTAGTWSLSFDSRDLIMDGSATVSVGPSAAAVAATGSSTSGSVDLTLLAFIVAAGIVLLGGAALVTRGHRSGQGETPVSVNG